MYVFVCPTQVPLYVVHVMSAGAAAAVTKARAAGQRVIGEAVASGFAADEGSVWNPDFRVPPSIS
jgi:dihydropyrimidinase